MEFKKILSTYLIKLEYGEELIKSLSELCSQEKIYSATVNAIGATNQVLLGLFDMSTKTYVSKEFKGDMEITSLMGNISKLGEDIFVHIHANLCNSEFNVIGGHVFELIVSATCELFLFTQNNELMRSRDENIGLNLWNISNVK